MPPSIAFLHTSPVHVATFSALLAKLTPSMTAVHYVDEALLDDARRLGPDAPSIVARVYAAMRAAAVPAYGAQVVVCTCSTIGAAAEACPTEGKFTAMRIDRAMADAAAKAGPNILIAAALASTIAPTAALIRSSAEKLGLAVNLSELFIADAWQHFELGDSLAYIRAIEVAVRAAPLGATVVVLAQASMAAALPALHNIGVPVLASPELGLRAALALVADGREVPLN